MENKYFEETVMSLGLDEQDANIEEQNLDNQGEDNIGDADGPKTGTDTGGGGGGQGGD
ncbi:hypothetical protein [Tenacibaculum discolor]|uniref:hypothetical protein n=1 Tax=Tenacibaculum discolor TaxID=361581 RepID=UPI000F2A87B3|nr:hypothetical protein [Tenacibaculum discolor]RLK03051.1 hypothetical protein C8N27_0899 [Tenacibaculum discolor]